MRVWASGSWFNSHESLFYYYVLILFIFSSIRKPIFGVFFLLEGPIFKIASGPPDSLRRPCSISLRNMTTCKKKELQNERILTLVKHGTKKFNLLE